MDRHCSHLFESWNQTMSIEGNRARPVMSPRSSHITYIYMWKKKFNIKLLTAYQSVSTEGTPIIAPQRTIVAWGAGTGQTCRQWHAMGCVYTLAYIFIKEQENYCSFNFLATVTNNYTRLSLSHRLQKSVDWWHTLHSWDWLYYRTRCLLYKHLGRRRTAVEGPRKTDRWIERRYKLTKAVQVGDDRSASLGLFFSKTFTRCTMNRIANFDDVGWLRRRCYGYRPWCALFSTIPACEQWSVVRVPHRSPSSSRYGLQ